MPNLTYDSLKSGALEVFVLNGSPGLSSLTSVDNLGVPWDGGMVRETMRQPWQVSQSDPTATNYVNTWNPRGVASGTSQAIIEGVQLVDDHAFSTPNTEAISRAYSAIIGETITVVVRYSGVTYAPVGVTFAGPFVTPANVTTEIDNAIRAVTGQPAGNHSWLSGTTKGRVRISAGPYVGVLNDDDYVRIVAPSSELALNHLGFFVGQIGKALTTNADAAQGPGDYEDGLETFVAGDSNYQAVQNRSLLNIWSEVNNIRDLVLHGFQGLHAASDDREQYGFTGVKFFQDNIHQGVDATLKTGYPRTTEATPIWMTAATLPGGAQVANSPAWNVYNVLRSYVPEELNLNMGLLANAAAAVGTGEWSFVLSGNNTHGASLDHYMGDYARFEALVPDAVDDLLWNGTYAYFQHRGNQFQVLVPVNTPTLTPKATNRPIDFQLWDFYGAVESAKSRFSITPNGSIVEGNATLSAIPLFAHMEGDGATATAAAAHAEGTNTTASGSSAHAEGSTTVASANAAHAEGISVSALGIASHAEGAATQAVADKSHAEGNSTIALGVDSHAEGDSTQATNDQAHAEGLLTLASGISSHAEGEGTTASGQGSHAEGNLSAANSNFSHAEGNSTTASAVYAHSEGNGTIASGVSSHAEGDSSTALSLAAHAEGISTTASGSASHSEGYATVASGNQAHAEGDFTSATNVASHSEGLGFDVVNPNIASGIAAHAEGYLTQATGDYSHAEGSGDDSGCPGACVFNLASGVGSHVEGYSNIAAGDYCHVEGTGNNAQVGADYVHIEGYLNVITGFGDYSHAEGGLNNITGTFSHAEGYSNIVSGVYAHAEGYGNTASGASSHAEGRDNLTSDGLAINGDYAHVEGRYNEAAGNYSHAEGLRTKTHDTFGTVGQAAHAEGEYTWAYGNAAHSEGLGTGAGTENIASGDGSHAEGYEGVIASGIGSHAEGQGTLASALSAHAEGGATIASNLAAHAEGQFSQATATASHAEGGATIASGNYSHAEGFSTESAGASSNAKGIDSYAQYQSSMAHANERLGSTNAWDMQYERIVLRNRFTTTALGQLIGQIAIPANSVAGVFAEVTVVEVSEGVPQIQLNRSVGAPFYPTTMWSWLLMGVVCNDGVTTEVWANPLATPSVFRVARYQQNTNNLCQMATSGSNLQFTLDVNNLPTTGNAFWAIAVVKLDWIRANTYP